MPELQQAANLNQAFEGKGLPPYVSGGAGPFDGVLAYNLTGANLATWRAALGRVAAGSGGADALLIGDSAMAGSTTTGGVYQVSGMWSHYFRSPDPNLAGLQSDGFVRIVQSSAFADPRWGGITGSWVNSTTWANSTTVGGTATLTMAVASTSCALWYFDYADGAQITIQPGGGAAATVVTCSGPTGWKRKVISGLATATTTMTVTHTSGANMSIRGGALWNPNTLLIHNIAQPSATAGGTGLGSWTDNLNSQSPWSNYVALSDIAIANGTAVPDLALIGLGGNDVKNTVNASIAATDAAVLKIRNAYPSSSVVLCASQQLVTSLLPDSVWESYVNSLYNVADNNGCGLLDFRAMVGDYAATVAAGYTVDGQGHFLPWANAMLGRAAAKALL